MIDMTGKCLEQLCKFFFQWSLTLTLNMDSFSWESSPEKAKKSFTLASKENKKWAGDSQDHLADWLHDAKYGNDTFVFYTLI
jgi:hypothetical protein